MKRLFEQFKSLSTKAKFFAILVALFLIGSFVIAFFGGNEEEVHVSPTHQRAKTSTPPNKLIVMNPKAMDGKPDGIIASESIDSKKDNNEDGIQPIDEEDEGDLSKLIKAHMRNNTIMIVSMNGGFLSHAANLLCSLSRFNLTKYVLFWALDKTALLALKRYKAKTKNHGVVMDFGIYYNASKMEYPADALRYFLYTTD